MNLLEILFQREAPTGVWVLVDPDSKPIPEIVKDVIAAQTEGASVILVGGSFLTQDIFDIAVQEIKRNTNLPVILFPGNSRQLSRHADGLLFTSLLSGRNPQYLIAEQVMAAPLVMQMKLPSLPTAYLLIESGRTTAAQFVSDTHPIPRDKPSLAAAHAQASVLLGMKIVYLEAGSGAEFPVPQALIRTVTKAVDVPIIVGGGIKTPMDAYNASQAGAKAIIIGTAIEVERTGLIEEIIELIHSDQA